jgi:hypothetical protein
MGKGGGGGGGGGSTQTVHQPDPYERYSTAVGTLLHGWDAYKFYPWVASRREVDWFPDMLASVGRYSFPGVTLPSAFIGGNPMMNITGVSPGGSNPFASFSQYMGGPVSPPPPLSPRFGGRDVAFGMPPLSPAPRSGQQKGAPRVTGGPSGTIGPVALGPPTPFRRESAEF